MITDIDTFLRYFRGVHRRTMRDVGALPPEAEGWSPPAGEGDYAWDIAELVRHIAGTRMYFARAYRNEGWIADWDPPISEKQSTWVPALEASFEEFDRRIHDTPDEWLTRKVEMLGTDATLSGWRVLMMMVEHEVHHRSQIDTYAGLQGWKVPQIYDRSAEEVGLQRERQREKHPG
jgi:uncharacterized damage-inducible protein DinB